jgi:iron only hydrogenase large subunit-like protein
MASSSSVLLDNVDDYLAPSQACINPLFQPPSEKEEEKKEEKEEKETPAVVVPNRRRRRPITVPASAESFAVAKTAKVPTTVPSEPKPVVKASIVDCLACSGCVTTAETVLLEQRHSLESLRKRLQSDDKTVRAITLSPNSWADMCRHWQLSAGDRATCCQFATLLNQMLDAVLVVDGNLPLQWTWLDEAQEFTELYKQSQQQRTNEKTTQGFSAAVDSSKTLYYQPDGTTKTVDNATDQQNVTTMPLISGSCPALICLVEKSMSHLVPNLSQSQSPMTRLGTVLKQQDTTTWDHWAIMPCHDKKLEASRQDFVHSNKGNVVDLVITSSECVELVDEWIQSATGNSETTVKSYLQTLAQAQERTIVTPDEFPKTAPTDATYLTTPTWKQVGDMDHSRAKQMASSSGGHANFIFSYAAKEMFGCSLDTVEWNAASLTSNGTKKAIKSARLARAQKQHCYKAQLFQQADGKYTQTPSEQGQAPVLDFSIAHGMQPMQRALKELSGETHYLEAMACPHGGCVNGGGAVKSTVGRETPTETRQRVQGTLHSLEIPKKNLADVPRPLRTRYHVVPPMQHTIGAAAGVKVEDIVW